MAEETGSNRTETRSDKRIFVDYRLDSAISHSCDDQRIF